MTNVDFFIDELRKLPHDNGSNLVWYFDTDYELGRVKILMRDRSQKPVRAKVQRCPFEEIMAMVEPRLAAKSIIEKMYYDFGEHIVDEKLLMTPEEAADILREYIKEIEECGTWVDIYDGDFITALNVAIKCMEVTE